MADTNPDHPAHNMPLEFLALTSSRCPDFNPETVMQQTGKSLLVAGTFGSKPAVVKYLTDRGAFWQSRSLHEIEFYRAIRECNLPVRIPEPFHRTGPSTSSTPCPIRLIVRAAHAQLNDHTVPLW